jgi:hypothetical protein
VKEGVYFINELKQSPYPFTPIPPLILFLFSKIPTNVSFYFFILIDVVIAGLFYLLSQKKGKSDLNPHLLPLMLIF